MAPRMVSSVAMARQRRTRYPAIPVRRVAVADILDF